MNDFEGQSSIERQNQPETMKEKSEKFFSESFKKELKKGFGTLSVMVGGVAIAAALITGVSEVAPHIFQQDALSKANQTTIERVVSNDPTLKTEGIDFFSNDHVKIENALVKDLSKGYGRFNKETGKLEFQNYAYFMAADKKIPADYSFTGEIQTKADIALEDKIRDEISYTNNPQDQNENNDEVYVNIPPIPPITNFMGH